MPADSCSTSGPSASGKSTLVRQLRQIGNSDYNEEERKNFADLIWAGVCREMIDTIGRMEDLGLSFELKSSEVRGIPDLPGYRD